MCREQARANRNEPRRLVLITSSHSWSLIRGRSVSRVTPALLTRMSILPHFSTRPSISASTGPLSFTSQENASACPPAVVIAATVSASFSALRATQATFAPLPASASAIARPKPCDAPVTTAVWLERSTLSDPYGLSAMKLSPANQRPMTSDPAPCHLSLVITLAFHSVTLRLPVNSLQESSQDAAGADFPEGAVAVGKHFP